MHRLQDHLVVAALLEAPLAALQSHGFPALSMTPSKSAALPTLPTAAAGPALYARAAETQEDGEDTAIHILPVPRSDMAAASAVRVSLCTGKAGSGGGRVEGQGPGSDIDSEEESASLFASLVGVGRVGALEAFVPAEQRARLQRVFTHDEAGRFAALLADLGKRVFGLPVEKIKIFFTDASIGECCMRLR
jgi:hypothetical protein